jgi:hypothetical protein
MTETPHNEVGNSNHRCIAIADELGVSTKRHFRCIVISVTTDVGHKRTNTIDLNGDAR